MYVSVSANAADPSSLPVSTWKRGRTRIAHGVPDQIRQWVPGRYIVLGTDGYGRSDSRAQLRRHFEVDRAYIVLAALRALADESKLDMATVRQCMQKYNLDPNKPNPVTE